MSADEYESLKETLLSGKQPTLLLQTTALLTSIQIDLSTTDKRTKLGASLVLATLIKRGPISPEIVSCLPLLIQIVTKDGVWNSETEVRMQTRLTSHCVDLVTDILQRLAKHEQNVVKVMEHLLGLLAALLKYQHAGSLGFTLYETSMAVLGDGSLELRIRLAFAREIVECINPAVRRLSFKKWMAMVSNWIEKSYESAIFMVTALFSQRKENDFTKLMDTPDIESRVFEMISVAAHKWSAAESALLHVLSASSLHETGLVFLDQIRSISSGCDEEEEWNIPNNPGEIARREIKLDSDTRAHWAKLPNIQASWEVVLGSLVDKAYSCASDPVPIQFLSTILSNLVDKSPAAVVFDKVLAKLRDNDTLLEMEYAESEHAQDVLLLKLNPLLVLKTVPIRFQTMLSETSLESHPIFPALISELTTYIDSLSDNDAVSRLACEAMAQLPPTATLPTLHSNLTQPKSLNPKITARYIYTSCLVVSIHHLEATAFLGVLTSDVEALLVLLLDGDAFDSQSTESLVIGCIEFLSVSFQHASSVEVVVEAFRESHQFAGFTSFLELAIAILDVQKLGLESDGTHGWVAGELEKIQTQINASNEPSDLQAALSTTMANAITTALKRISGGKEVDDPDGLIKVQALFRATGPTLLRVAKHCVQAPPQEGNRFSSIASASLQSLFHFYFALKSQDLCLDVEIVDACLDFLTCKDLAVVAMALKLVGVLVSRKSFRRNVDRVRVRRMGCVVREVASSLMMDSELRAFAGRIGVLLDDDSREC
ncbi:hypothetical protein HDU98_008076 [Podochytrium sp. JEL0797]|nr:hypothetical protein HDU98_008076 [Podochytrium sp. JEL0797]